MQALQAERDEREIQLKAQVIIGINFNFSNLSAQIDELNEKVEILNGRIAALTKENNELQDDVTMLKHEKRMLNEKISQLNDAIRQKNRINRELNDRLFIAKSHFLTAKDATTGIFSGLVNLKEMIKSFSRMGAEALTPRPDFKKLLTEKKVEHLFSTGDLDMHYEVRLTIIIR